MQFVYARFMKTITLDDAAYERLKAWKRSQRDSFSQVVRRVVPEPGTLRAFLAFAEVHGTDRLPGNEVLEAAVCLAHGLPLVSRDRRHFDLVPDLRVEVPDAESGG